MTSFSPEGKVKKAAQPDALRRQFMERLALVGTADHGLVEIDLAGQCYQSSGSSAKLLGLARDAGTLAELIATLDAAGVKDMMTSDGAVLLFNASNVPLRLRTMPSPAGFCMLLVEDMTGPYEFESTHSDRGYDVGGLFANAPYGIYRSTFEGQPLTANPAMLALNGCSDESELFSGLETTSDWYVDASRRQVLLQELQQRGRVVDFVSEINVGNTGQRMWVSETAWVVKDEKGAPKLIEGTVIDATQRVRQEQDMQRQATTDQLTGLGNRMALMAQLGDVGKSETPVAVILIDVDRFKDINDIFGHERGDQVLLKLARRLRRAVPQHAFIARLGGDEFAVIAPCGEAGETTNSETSDLVRKIIAEFETPLTINDSTHLVGASIGVSFYPKDAQTASELMRAADLALYQAKNTGKGRGEFYHDGLAREKRERLLLSNDLRGADKRGELELHYQSIVDASTAEIVGLEALMRWRHPVRGLISPADFIPVAEEQGMMGGFGAWAINEACQHMTSIPADMHIAVNVSASQFYSCNLVAVVRDALAAHGVAASRLELEVTENLVLRNEMATLKTLEELKALGVRIAIDDFGTGYSSLSYLQRFAFDKIKIDRSFVQSIKSNSVNAAIVRAVLSIGRDLGLDVVAEGVETESERNALLDEGCPYFQGFLYSRPKPLASVVTDLNVERLRGVAADTKLDEQTNVA